MAGSAPPPGHGQSLGAQIEGMIARMPPDHVSMGELLDLFGDEGLLLVTILLTLVFLIPVSIPGVSTVFGAAIVLVGVSRLLRRQLWLPARVRDRRLPSARLRPALAKRSPAAMASRSRLPGCVPTGPAPATCWPPRPCWWPRRKTWPA